MLRKPLVHAAFAALCLVTVVPVWAAAPALSAQQILARTAETYRTVTGYAWRGQVTTHMTVQGNRQDVDNVVLAYYGGPGRARFESQAGGAETLYLTSGDSSWSYAGTLGQYAVAKTPADRPQNPLPGIDPFAAHPLAGFARIADGVKEARRLDDAQVTVDGASVPVYVVEVSYDATIVPPDSTSKVSPKRYWIDQQRYVVLADSLAVERHHPSLPQAITIAQMASATHVDWDAKPADTLFAFQAPAGAQRVEQLGRAPGGSNGASASSGGGADADDRPDPWVGKILPEFALADLKGITRPLSASRGKVVLLDFWATWCGPCRRELPTIQKLHTRYGAKGLDVLAINCSESKTLVSSFLRANRYTIPTLLDRDGAVQSRFGIDGIPTLFVLDAKGTVVAHLVGLRGEDDLKDALKQAGLAIGP